MVRLTNEEYRKKVQQAFYDKKSKEGWVGFERKTNHDFSAENRARQELKKINLEDYLCTYAGFARDKSSTAGSREQTLRRGYTGPGTGDKIRVGVSKSGDWTFVDARDHRRGGSIIDYHAIFDLGIHDKKLTGAQFKEITDKIGSNIGSAPLQSASAAGTVKTSHETVKRSLEEVQKIWQQYQPITKDDPYLVNERQIKPETVQAFLDGGDIARRTKTGVICFPHRDISAKELGPVSGWDMKGENKEKSGKFLSGGTPGIWMCRPVIASQEHLESSAPGRIVVSENAIDAMSFFELHGRPGDVYYGIGGQLKDVQKEYLKQHFADSEQVIIATDNDAAGNRFAAGIKEVCPLADRITPKSKDFNQDLKDYRQMADEDKSSYEIEDEMTISEAQENNYDSSLDLDFDFDYQKPAVVVEEEPIRRRKTSSCPGWLKSAEAGRAAEHQHSQAQ